MNFEPKNAKTMNPLNLKAKDLMLLYGFSLSTAKKRMREIKQKFNLQGVQLISYLEVAEYFGQNPELLLSRINPGK